MTPRLKPAGSPPSSPLRRAVATGRLAGNTVRSAVGDGTTHVPPPGRLATGAVALAAVCLAANPACAYVNPGTGCIAMQVLLGGVAGLLVALRIVWRRLRSRFVRRGRREP